VEKDDGEMMNHPDSLQGFSEPMAKAIAFIWKEAEILDRKDYASWLALWSEDGHYVVPIDPQATDFAAQLNYAYDDARMRKMRIERLTSGFAMSATDASATVRTVSRFTLVATEGDVVEVNSAQVLVGYKRQAHTLFVANLTHRIRFGAEGPKLEQKVVRLINSEDALNALGFLL
jgi:3-phenylpropionate/cinnamic acid dioxygenase small subunit